MVENTPGCSCHQCRTELLLLLALATTTNYPSNLREQERRRNKLAKYTLEKITLKKTNLEKNTPWEKKTLPEAQRTQIIDSVNPSISGSVVPLAMFTNASGATWPNLQLCNNQTYIKPQSDNSVEPKC